MNTYTKLHCEKDLEYTDYIHCRRLRLSLPKKWVSCIGYLTATNGETPVLKICGVWNTPSLPLFPNPPGIIWSYLLSQIDQFENYLHLIGILRAS